MSSNCSVSATSVTPHLSEKPNFNGAKENKPHKNLNIHPNYCPH